MTGTGDEDTDDPWGLGDYEPQTSPRFNEGQPRPVSIITPRQSQPEPPPPPAKAAQPLAAPPKPSRSGSETRDKSKVIPSRYSPEEWEQVNEAASRAGLTRSSYQRIQTLQTAPKTRSTRRAPIERETLAKVLGQLGKIGSNLNQIARSINRGRNTYDEGEIFAAVAELRALLPAIYGALGAKK